MSRWIGVFSFLAGMASLWLTTNAHAITPYIIIDADSGAVMQESKADVPWYPASLTKLMTLYVTFEQLSKKKLSLASEMTASLKASQQPNKKLGLEKGEVISVEKAIYALSTISANDAAVALAEHIAGSEKKFARLMNKTAKAVGMQDTVFRNASGLPDAKQQTTARDMAILAQAIIKNYPQYYHVFANRALTHKGEELLSHNAFLYQYQGAEGFKTGYTCGSGYNLVASAKQGDVRLISVVLGAETPQKRLQLTTQLLNEGFELTPDAPGLMLVAFRRSVPLSAEPEYVIERPGCAQF